MMVGVLWFEFDGCGNVYVDGVFFILCVGEIVGVVGL